MFFLCASLYSRLANGYFLSFMCCPHRDISIFTLYELAPSIVGVGYDEFAGGGVGKGYYITLYIVDVIVEVVAAICHSDTVTLLVVEEAEGLAVGRLGEYLRAVEQVLGCSRAHGFTSADALGIVGVTKGRSAFFSRYKLPALPCHAPATVSGRVSDGIVGYRLPVVGCQQVMPRAFRVAVGYRFGRRDACQIAECIGICGLTSCLCS